MMKILATVSLITKAVHDFVADKLLKLVGGLIMEPKGADGSWFVSLGRMSFWLVLGHMLWCWWNVKPVDGSELSAFYALLGYQGTKIVGGAVTDTAAAWKAPAPPPPAPAVSAGAAASLKP